MQNCGLETHLLNTVTDRLELVLEVLTASLGGIEVALCGQRQNCQILAKEFCMGNCNAPIIMPRPRRTTRSLWRRRRLVSAKRRGRASEKAGALAPLRIKAGKTHASATRPRLRTGLGDGEPESRRPQARNAGKRQKRTWHALQQADVEVHLVPLDGLRAREEEGSVWCCGAQGRRDVDAVRQRTTPSIFLNGRAADVCHSCGLRRIRLFCKAAEGAAVRHRFARRGWTRL